MSRHLEYINAAGLRLDGRRPREHRRTMVELGTFPNNTDGSCTVTSGGTKVVARVVGPRELGHRAAEASDGAVILCEATVTAFAGERRKNIQKKSRQTSDIQQAVLCTAQSLVQCHQYPASQIQIYVDVLHHDGGEIAAAINAACLALADANIAMRDVAVALTAGILDTVTVCDLTASELKSQCPMATIAVRAHDPDAIVFCDMVSRVSDVALDSMFQHASECSKGVAEVFRSVLARHADEALEIMQEKTLR